MIFKAKQQTIPELSPLEPKVGLGEKKRTKKKQPPKGSRWTILILFLLTLGVTGIFYLKTALPPLWQKWTAPLIISNVKPEEKFDASLILAEIKNSTQGLRGKYGFYVYELKNNNNYGLYQNEIFPSASLMKLPVILCFYQEVEKGNLSLTGEYVLKEKDKVSGAGILQGKTVGTVYTYQQLIEFMGQYSDNTAFKVMRGILTDIKIQNTIDELEMKNTSLANFETTPEDIGLFFKKLYQDKIINEIHKDSLLKFLTKTAFENWLPAGLPEDIKISHKIGKDVGTFSDGGIVFASKPYIIIVMSKDAKEIEANEVLPKISESVWEWENFSKSL